MNPWLSWLYHYGVGGLLFAGSLALASFSGAFDLKRRYDRRLVAVLVGGLLTWMSWHALWIVLVS